MDKTQKLYPFKFEADCRTLDENSTIANGFLSENSIDDVLDTYLGEIAGNDNFQYYKGIFPLKVSFRELDSKGLAPQLHPDNATALERYMSMGKAKMWYITRSTPKTLLYLGFNRQMDASGFYNSCLEGTILDSLNKFTPKEGDYIYIKPGNIHAVEGALEFIEISQNSEVTYHLTGEDADMEIAEAIDVVDYTPSDESSWRVSNITGDTTIANTSAFIVKYLKLEKPAVKSTDESMIIYVCLAGKAHIEVNGAVYEFGKGEMVLVPAGMESFTLANECSGTGVLEICLPKVAEIEEDLYMNYYEDESNYPTGSGTDPEEDEEDECDDEHCGCGSHDDHCADHHHNGHCCCGHNHDHHHGHDHDGMDDDHRSHPGEFFFRH